MALSLYNMWDKKLLCSLILCLNIFSFHVLAQKKNYTVADAHAHNDYLHPIPFYTAWNAGFGSIEADVFPVNGELLVAHDSIAIWARRSLENLYITPLFSELKKNDKRKVNLLIDIKENYKTSLKLLIKELKPLKKYLFTDKDKTKPVIILISGERPPPDQYKNYPGYIFFDDDLKLFHSPEEWKRVGLVSLSFERYSSWKGEDVQPGEDKSLLIHVIDSVHRSGKPIRFWSAPDNKNSWMMQMNLGVDFIGTDKINIFSKFLKEE